MKYDVCVVGGAGHIGAILSILFAYKGLKVCILDINQNAMDKIASGKLPFLEINYENYLKKALDDDNLFFTTDKNEVKNAKNVIITIGTSVDEFQNPRINDILRCIDELPILNHQLLILRSTIYPGVTDYISRHLKNKNINPLIAFCPERLVQGDGINEIQNLPQIVSGTTEIASDKAAILFKLIAPSIVKMQTMEAEFAKLFANTFRYIQFAAANSFYEMTTMAGLNYNKVLEGAQQDYPRLRDLPKAGFSGGSCVLKDTLQLCAFAEGKFSLGESAVKVNEGLPAFLVSQLEKKHDLKTKVIGLLGMAFKQNSDDIRASLSYKLKKILTFKAKQVLTNDPLVQLSQDPDLLPLDEVLYKSDILIICVPHNEYSNLEINKEIVNIWNS